jgi:uncharacterized membrane protein
MSTSNSTCAGCRQRDARLDQLERRLAEVQAENARLRQALDDRTREQTRQANRSQPQETLQKTGP